MDELVARIREALEETERIALAAGGTAPHWGEGGDPYLYATESLNGKGDWCIARFGVGEPVFGDPQAQVAHVAHNDPASVLRDIAADREILELHVIYDTLPPGDFWKAGAHLCEVCSRTLEGELVHDDGPACKTVLAIAKRHRIDVPALAQ